MEPAKEISRVSIVCPVYRNSEVLAELHARISRALAPLNLDYEVLLINDACPQGSLAVLRELATKDARVGVISLAQNIGQQKSIMLGLAHTQGEVVVTMDADLQDPPEAIPTLLGSLDSHFQVVFAGRRGKYETRSRLLTSRIYKSILHWLTRIPIDAGLFLAMKRRVVESVLLMQDTDPYLVAMIGCTGFPTRSIPVERNIRASGQSAYSSWGRIRSGAGAIRWVLKWKLGVKPAANPIPYVDGADIEFIGERFSNGSERNAG